MEANRGGTSQKTVRSEFGYFKKFETGPGRAIYQSAPPKRKSKAEKIVVTFPVPHSILILLFLLVR